MGENLSDKIHVLITKIDESLTGFDKEAIETTAAPLIDLRDDLRETIQAHLCEPAERLIKKLKRNDELSPQDIQMIEKWVVGDAEYYTKLENNLMDWIAECKRLCNVILSYYAEEEIEENDDKLFDLSALITDLKCTLDDVIRYYQAMNRVDQFKSTIGKGTLTKETKKWLADLVERQLYSKDF